MKIKLQKLTKKKFSLIIAFHDEHQYLEDAMSSVINQTCGFKDNIQIILVDCASDDETHEIAVRYESKFPENILLLTQDSPSIFDGRNLGLEYSTGDYVNFLDFHDYLDENAIKELDKALGKYNHDVICLPVATFKEDDERKFPRKYGKTGLIDLNEFPNFFLKFIYSSFIKRDILEDIRFDSRIVDGEEIAFANKVLIKSESYVLLENESYYYYKKRRMVHKELMDSKEYYLTQMNYFLLDLIKYSLEQHNEVKTFIKRLIIRKLIFLMDDTEIPELLSENELEQFFNSLHYILSHFDIDEIIEICDNINRSSFFIAVKTGEIGFNNILTGKTPDLNINTNDNNVQIFSNEHLIYDLSSKQLILDFATLRDDVLYFSGYFESLIDNDDISITGIREFKNGDTETIDASYYHYPTRDFNSMLGLRWLNFYNFDLAIPITSKNEKSSIKIIVKYKNSVKFNPKLRFRTYCNITYESNYYVKEGMIIMFDNNAFNVMPYSYIKMFGFEVKGLIGILINRELFYKQALFFRVMYLVLYPIMKNREIWIIMDRKQVADDNAEHFFKYALKQNDGIKKFFSINRTSEDYDRLQETYGNVLAFESIKHRFYYTFASKIISSQGSEFYLNPFRHREYYQTAGISNIDFYFLQHGIIKDNMSSWLRKYDRNPKLIVTSTQMEYESLFDEGYNYGDKVIQLLGLPRYDNLNNKGLKKQIVIMPSWRNYLTNEEIFKESEYFKRFNSLINNERLIKHANEKGYEILFKPHPELLRYLDLFDKNDYVQIDEHKKYQVIFNESAVLVTDYSSIFFDFAYLKKPLIYYQYANDYHYDSENGYFQYETMGFGPVIKDEDELVDKLIEYMNNDCIMEDKYKKRVDEIFKYNDHNNSKRCYDWIYNH